MPGVLLTPTSARGLWSGVAPFHPQDSAQAGPVVALTRATMRLRTFLRFWRRVPDISAVIGQDPNVIFKIGIGEVPLLHQVTFSIWPDAASMANFARGDGPHGRAIRAVAKEKHGAKLMGINVDHVYAMSFGIGLACLGAAACFLLPAYYVNPQVGSGFVLVAFTIVVLGGMGSFAGALLGGLLIGVVESLGGLYLGESLGQIGIFAIFIAVLLVRPQGLFGAKA